MKKFALLLILGCISICSYGQIKESTAVDSIFSSWNKPDTPGSSIGIIRDGELIYAKGYGLANLEYDISNTASSVFRIGSTSKQFTAACIVLLAEQGKLNLDQTLKHFYPDFPAYAEKITIRHLLNHTSGIRDYLQIAYLKGLRNDDYYVNENIMQWLTNQSDLNFLPGDEHLYSNSGYWLLGQIVNQVAGMNMADFAQKEIFEPLGMNNTHFHNDHTHIVKNRASGYVPNSSGGYSISMTTLGMIGDGGIFTTINDIKKWDDAYYDSDVLSPSFWKIMTQQAILNNGKEISYASGLMVNTYKGLKTVSHGGAFVGFRAELLRFPEQRFSVAIFANRGDANPTRMAYQVAEIFLKDKLVNEESKPAKSESQINTPVEEFSFSQIAGDYQVRAGVILKLSIKNDSLHVLQLWNNSAYNIIKSNGNTFELPGVADLSFTFTDLKEGLVQNLIILQNGQETTAKRKAEIDMSEINMEDYSGSYFSKELDANYHFILENGALQMRIENNALKPCTLDKVDEFVLDIGTIRFQRKNGVVSGFELDSGRVKNLKFEKL